MSITTPTRFIEISKLNRTTADDVIVHTKSIFARHGIPEIVVSDNGLQYSSEAFAKFAHEYQFEHVTSSPYHPQSNGEAERAVQTVKRLLKKEGDPYLALLSYRATPLQCGYSPSELLMARKLRTNIPITREQLKPKVPDQSSLRERDERDKARQQSNYDQHHRAKELSPLMAGQMVWMPDRNEEAKVVQEAGTRSYEVETSEGMYRCNRRALISIPETQPNDTNTSISEEMLNDKTEPTLRRSNRESNPPSRFDPSWNI